MPRARCSKIATTFVTRPKLHDDFCGMGEYISPNRVWRLACLAGVKAQLGYKKKPGLYGGSPATVADHTRKRALEDERQISFG
ncbi:hypothetical protein [Thioclava sp. SK-1]|uniref:hypothetical protein n=1 Tax=Thioclava sp. SK-1 TaxID=1889770 RepID=UPI000824D25C|nr:hypothetical protein [Thioclava sp. SK-1]